MPNYCENDLYVVGSKDDVEAVLKAIESPESVIDFNKIIPYPEEFAAKDREMNELGWEKFRQKYGEQARDGFNSGGYDWCISNWGTKWNAGKATRRDFGPVCISFETPWTPPEPVIWALHKMFPTVTLHLEYFERGMAFCGGFSCFSKDASSLPDWQAGVTESAWEGKYQGHRGG